MAIKVVILSLCFSSESSCQEMPKNQKVASALPDPPKARPLVGLMKLFLMALITFPIQANMYQDALGKGHCSERAMSGSGETHVKGS